MSECWEHMGVGMKVEVACGAEGVTKDAYWVATVIGIAGKQFVVNLVIVVHSIDSGLSLLMN